MNRPTPGEAVSPHRATTEVEVRYAETDQMGVVHHSHYLVWFELARTRLCAESGYHYAEIEKMGYLLSVIDCQLSFRRSAVYGDRVQVVAWADEMTSRTLRFFYEVKRGDESLATGMTRHVWLRKSTGRPCRIPAVLKDPFAKLAGRPSSA
jgi:acyl-CoA thioester hydrolase